MNNILVKSIAATAVVAGLGLGAATPAAAFPMHHHWVQPWPAPAPWFGYGYAPSYYSGYYPDYYPGYYYDPGAAIAAGVFGSIIGGIVHHNAPCLHVYHHNGKTYCRI